MTPFCISMRKPYFSPSYHFYSEFITPPPTRSSRSGRACAARRSGCHPARMHDLRTTCRILRLVTRYLGSLGLVSHRRSGRIPRLLRLQPSEQRCPGWPAQPPRCVCGRRQGCKAGGSFDRPSPPRLGFSPSRTARDHWRFWPKRTRVAREPNYMGRLLRLLEVFKAAHCVDIIII